MKKRSLTVLALASALTVFALIPSAFAVKSASDSHAGTAVQETQSRHGRHSSGKMGEKTAEPENAIGKEAAKAAALADAGLTEEQAGKVKAHVSQLDDGTVVYKVNFTYDGQRYAYHINAVTGVVVDKENEAVTEDTESREHGKRGMGQNSVKATLTVV
ncbi:MAG: PepSY domain-containing protein [Abditibacteriota bacterium]|nr:PepSY domain-containing protein [Abditibacteriota bacterium]